MNCRYCHVELKDVFIDLESAPPSNSYLLADGLKRAELYYPLRVMVCGSCWLLQTQDFAAANELFTEHYAYFSSTSSSWLLHSENYAESMIERFGLGKESLVAEVASNDGYLLQYFRQREVPCYGVEPTASTAEVARGKGIKVIEDFFGQNLAESLVQSKRQVDLAIANNVLAHVPNINDFVSGFTLLLKPHGIATFEFPHLFRLVQNNQFDTIYHEHYSYLSLNTVQDIFVSHGLEIFDVEELETHGGSLRVFAQRKGVGEHAVSGRVIELLQFEIDQGMRTKEFYSGFQQRADGIKDSFLRYLLDCKKQGLSVAAYGAAAKGNTLINYAGIHRDLLPYVVDQNPAKQGKFLPGSRIPIFDCAFLREHRPDRVIILPWNLANEISGQISYVRDWSARFVTFIPDFKEF